MPIDPELSASRPKRDLAEDCRRLYAEMDRMSSEELGYFDPRPWHEDRPQRPKTWPLETSKNYWGP